jgi:macrolide-specific efflux system membrane fusion protein
MIRRASGYRELGTWAALAGLILGAVGVLAVGRRAPEARFAPPPEPVGRAAVADTLRAAGRLEARATVRVGGTSGGQVVEVKVAVGDRVARGQVLARLDDLEQRRRVDVERALLELADLKGIQAEKRFVELIRALQGDAIVPDLIDTDHVMPGELGDAQLGVLATSSQTNAQKGVLALARQALARRLVRAPVDGIVVDVGVASGETVGASPPAPPMFVIGSDPANLTLRVELEADAGARVAPGPVSFRVASLGDRAFQGTIRPASAGSAVPVTSARREVLIDVANADLALRPGMPAIVSFSLNSPPSEMSSGR